MRLTITYLIVLLLITACDKVKPEQFTGFWEGPHPFNPEKNFYVEIDCENDSFQAWGYWTENRHYQSEFSIDSVGISGDRLSFFVPAWNCHYSGILREKELITGGFLCEGEPFDTVFLVRDASIENHLKYSRQGCKAPDFEYTYVSPVKVDDLLETSAYTEEGDSLFIHSLLPGIIHGEYGRINSFLMYRGGSLICEEYFYAYTRDDLHQIESCTKSVSSLLLGIARDLGFVSDLSESLYRIFPEYTVLREKGYRDLNTEIVLTMTSGYELMDREVFGSKDLIETALTRPLVHPPGTVFQYDGGNTEILGAVLKLKTGMFADDFARKYLFGPLKIEHFSWDDPAKNGYPLMSGSLCLTPRSMVKIGAMVLNKGAFNKQQVVSSSWIDKSTSALRESGVPGDKYGYQWWKIMLDSGGKTYETIWANGWGSQFIYIIPDLDAVIVTTGYNYENDSWAISSGIGKYLHYLDSYEQ